MTDSTIEAQRDAAIARAERAEQMVAELRASLNDADDIIRDYAPGFKVWIDHASAVLARTEPVAWRWVLATERDALRAEVLRLREACLAALPHHQGGHSAVGRLLRAALTPERR